jgi:hypothetical protein
MRNVCSVTALSKATERPVLTTFALPLFAVAKTVFSVASAGDHQQMVLTLQIVTLQKAICCEELIWQSHLQQNLKPIICCKR